MNINAVFGIAIIAVGVLTGCSNSELQSRVEKETANAEAVMAEAVALKMPTWVPNHYQTLQTLYDTGQAHANKKDYKKANKTLDRFYTHYASAKADTLDAQKQAALKIADRDQLAAQATTLQQRLNNKNRQYMASEKKATRLEEKVTALEAEVASQNARLQSIQSASKTTDYVVQPGDTLNSIAAQPTVYNDPEKWTLLYENNRASLENETTIYPGQVLQIISEN